jgi:hypothetical protein
VTDASRLFVPGYYSGYSNNRMSLDIAIVLAHLTGRVLVPYRFRMPRRHPVEQDPTAIPAPMVVPELFEIPVPWSGEHLLRTWISEPDSTRWDWEPVYDSVVCLDAVPPPDDERFRHFRNERTHVYPVGLRSAEGRDLHITTQGLGNYSTCFYLDEQRGRDVVNLMRQVRPKEPYAAAAARIVNGLGTYNAIHLRRGDFLVNDLARRGISRAATVSGREIVSNLAARMDRDDPLVICTDGAPGEEIFGPIQQHFRHSVFLDRHLRDDASARESVAGLPSAGEAVDALLTQLVAAAATTFAGTNFSTFTGLIHRMRGFADPGSEVLYCYNDFLSPLTRFDRGAFLPVDDGPFSWNRVRYPVSPDAYSWMREWPEAWSSRAASPEEPCPPGPAGHTRELTADAATLHGTALRCIEGTGGRPVLIDWTDPAEHPAWHPHLDGGTYEVEIRYACPEESAGSAYTVDAGSGEELTATVWNTGAWTSTSPWLPLGRLELAEGPNTLVVRAQNLAGLAVMNLTGLRLRPCRPCTRPG